MKLTVCELYAGLAAMSSTFELLGWTILLLCEWEPHLQSYLQHKFPNANVQPDVNQSPWKAWARDKIHVLLVCAGVACQPFSDAGMRLADQDDRAYQAMLVADAALALTAAYVLLENVPNFVTKDDTHHMFTRICDYFAQLGFVLQHIEYPVHHKCGGNTTRARVLVFFQHVNAIAVAFVDRPIVERVPVKLEGDHRRNLLSCGTAHEYRGGRLDSGLQPVAKLHLTYHLCEGAVIRISGSKQEWHVQKIQGMRVSLLNTDRRHPMCTSVHTSAIEAIVDCKEARTTVYDPKGLLQTITAFGCQPGAGASLLNMSSGTDLYNDFRAYSTRDRYVCNECPLDALEFLRRNGCSEEKQNSYAGNSIPVSMLRRPAADIDSSIRSQLAAAEGAAEVTTNTADGPPPAGPAPARRQTIVLVAFMHSKHGAQVFLSNGNFQQVVVEAAEARTGGVVKNTAHLSSGGHQFLVGTHETDQETLLIVGELLGAKPETHTICDVESATSDVQAIVSKTLAWTYAAMDGEITVADIAPLLDESTACAGAYAPKRLKPNKVSDARTLATRSTAQAFLKKALVAETDLANEMAAQAQGLDNDKTIYMQEWSQQITTTSHFPAPESALQNIPVFDDPLLASMRFSDKCRLPTTSRLPRPKNPPPDDGVPWPSCEEDLYISVEARESLDLAEEAVCNFVRMQGDPTTNDSKVRKSRPKPRLFGHILKKCYRKTVWDNRGQKPVPANFDAPIKTKINRPEFRKSFTRLGMGDHRLLQFVEHGVLSDTGHMPRKFRVVAPLHSLRNGFTEVEKDLDRLSSLNYIRKHARRPFIPYYTNAQGARAKRGTTKQRRISDAGLPYEETVDEDGEAATSLNAEAKWDQDGNDKLPKEIKMQPSDVLNDMAILRYICDLLHWTLFLWTDDLADFFLQLSMHPSELWRLNFLFPTKSGTEALNYVNELVMGFGYTYASNIAQRFANAIALMFIDEFERADAPHLERERAESKVLDAWCEHRSKLGPTQMRLLVGNFFTDDLLGMVANARRAVLSLLVWYDVTRRIGVLTAVPRKRSIGTAIRWTGLVFATILGVVIITADKIQDTIRALSVAATGMLEVSAYRGLMGLLEFIRYALKLPRNTMHHMYGPLQQGGELHEGPSTRVRATNERQAGWLSWKETMMHTQYAPATAALPNQLPPKKSTRAFVWHGDAALEGTGRPALCGYSHGMYWIFELKSRHTEALHIAALEFLVVIGNFIIFGSMLVGSEEITTEMLSLLVRTDSLVDARVIADDSAKSPIMVYLHRLLIGLVEFIALEHVTTIAHQYGESNVLADHGSRGKVELLIDTCMTFGVKAKRIPIPNRFAMIIEKTVKHAQQTKEHSLLNQK